MLQKLGDVALGRTLSRVDLPFVSSGRNQPALDFLNSLDGASREPLGEGVLFRVSADVAARVRYDPERVAHGERSHAGPAPEHPGTTRDTAARLVSIARNLGDLDEIHAQVQARSVARPNLGVEYVEPRTPAERTVATILARVLGLDRVGVDDNFFELGGHSLLAMQVLFRIREAFGVELSARLLYTSAFTAADLAARVVQSQLDAADPARVSALLDRVNELSDDEVRALLALGAEPPEPPSET